MLPFARMVQYGNEVLHRTILDIDFSAASIGSTLVQDRSSNHIQFLLRLGTVGVVEYNNEIQSNVYNCSNSVGFMRTVDPIMGTALDFSNYDAFRIQYRMKCNSTALQVFFETGGYNSRRIYGVGNTFNQYSSSYNQLFIDWGQYARCLPNWSNELKWDTITIDFKKGLSIVMTSELYGTAEFPWYELSSNSSQYFSLFGSYIEGDNGLPAIPFTGLVQYVKITEIPR